MGSTVFRIPSDVIKPSGYRPRVLYTSSGILNTVDPLPSASNLYLEYAVMKCLNLIGQCEGSKSLRATVRGLYM